MAMDSLMKLGLFKSDKINLSGYSWVRFCLILVPYLVSCYHESIILIAASHY